VLFKNLPVMKDNAERVGSLQYQELYRRKQSCKELSFKQCVVNVAYSTIRVLAQNITKLRKDRIRNFLSPIREKSRNVKIKMSWTCYKLQSSV
jgi:hypothetical protein